MSQWQTMETAPHDGTLIDVWVWRPPERKGKNATGKRVIDVFWENAAHPGGGGRWSHRTHFSEYEPMAVETSYTYGDEKVTHWIPIPEPPKPITITE